MGSQPTLSVGGAKQSSLPGAGASARGLPGPGLTCCRMGGVGSRGRGLGAGRARRHPLNARLYFPLPAPTFLCQMPQDLLLSLP